MNVPWWLNPWHEARTWRTVARGQQKINDEQAARLQYSAAELNRLRGIIDEADRRIRSLQGQLASSVTDARTSGAALATDVPEIVIVGTSRGSRGKRIHVSRDIEVTAFAMTEIDNPPPRFKVGAIMGHLLIIDKPTYGEAMAQLATIWASQDREKAPTPQLPGGGNGTQDHL